MNWNEIKTIKVRAAQLEHDKISEIERLIKRIVEEVELIKREIRSLRNDIKRIGKI